MWNGNRDAPAWCCTETYDAGMPAPYPFCPAYALRPIPKCVRRGVDMRGMHDIALYPSSCVACRHKRGYSVGPMYMARRLAGNPAAGKTNDINYDIEKNHNREH